MGAEGGRYGGGFQQDNGRIRTAVAGSPLLLLMSAPGKSTGIGMEDIWSSYWAGVVILVWTLAMGKGELKLRMGEPPWPAAVWTWPGLVHIESSIQLKILI